MRFRFNILAICFSFILSGILIAQETCESIVQEAIETASRNCDGLRRNQVCYGNVTIDAQAAVDVTSFVFETAGDIVDVSDIASLRLSSQVDVSGDWGIAMMYVQANISDEIDENVQIVLFGDVEMDNVGFSGNIEQIEPLRSPDAETTAQALVPTNTPEPTLEPENIEITTTTNLNVRGGPSTNDAIVGTLGTGTTAIADARNETGDWLRISLVDGTVGWVYTPLVTVDGDIFVLNIADSNNLAAETNSDSNQFPDAVILTGNDQIQGQVAANSASIYLFTAVAGQRMSIRASSLNDSLDMNFSIFDANDNYVVGRIGAPAEIIDFRLEESGEYVLYLSGDNDSDASQEYELEFYLSAPAAYGPTNAFILSLDNNEANSSCDDLPESGILVQTPEGIGKISIFVNEVQIDLGSTAFIQTEPGEMSVGILEGLGTITTSAGSIAAIPGTQAQISFAAEDESSDVSDIEIELLDEAIVPLLPTELLDRTFSYRSLVTDLCAAGGFVWQPSPSEFTGDYRAVSRGINYFVRSGQTVTFRNEGGTLVNPETYSYVRLASVIIEDGEITTERETYLANSQSNRELSFTPSENVLFRVEYALNRNDGAVSFTGSCS
jgi:hypothetical protein